MGRDVQSARHQTDEAAKSDAAFHQLTSRLGTTPRERLAWLLDDFAYGRAVGEQSGEERFRLWVALGIVIRDATDGAWMPDAPERERVRRFSSRDHDRAPWQALAPVDRILLDDFRRSDVEAVVDIVQFTEKTVALLGEAQRVTRDALERLAAGRAYSRQVTAQVTAWPSMGGSGPGEVVPLWRAPLPDALIVAVLSLRSQVASGLLRRCSYGPRGTTEGACGHVFVGRKRQKFCRLHMNAAKQERDRRAQAARRAAHRKGRRALGRGRKKEVRNGGRRAARAKRQHKRRKRG